MHVQVKSFLGALNRFFIRHYVPPTAPAAVGKRKLYSLVRKRDRPSVLAWLAKASPEKRHLFRALMEAMQRSNQDDVTEHTAVGQALHTGQKLMDTVIYQVCSRNLGPLNSIYGKCY